MLSGRVSARRLDLAAIAGGATAIGFNFYPRSPRYIAPERAAAISTPGVRRVGVFVNEPAERVADLVKRIGLHVAQLHGDEQPEQYPAGVRVWKAARVDDQFTLAAWDTCPADYRYLVEHGRLPDE